MRKLIGLGDIKVMTINSHCVGNKIPMIETTQVLSLISDATYVLYTIYRTHHFKDSLEIDDIAISKILGWNPRKVRDHRLLLEKAGLFLSIRYGSKADGITKVFVGMDVVALFNAGMPCDILEPKAFNKLKAEFSIKSPKDLVDKAAAIVATFEQDPTKYL